MQWRSSWRRSNKARTQRNNEIKSKIAVLAQEENIIVLHLLLKVTAVISEGEVKTERTKGEEVNPTPIKGKNESMVHLHLVRTLLVHKQDVGRKHWQDNLKKQNVKQLKLNVMIAQFL